MVLLKWYVLYADLPSVCKTILSLIVLNMQLLKLDPT